MGPHASTEAESLTGETCLPCSTGPTGIAGHEQLYSHTMGADEMHFRCRGCGRAWSRRGSAGGPFEWHAIASPSGAGTPGRPGTTPP